jgi:hypothetical protein
MNLDADADARAINARPWKPLPGMVKLRCSECQYWFAARDPATKYCRDCAIRRGRQEVARLNSVRKAS